MDDRSRPFGFPAGNSSSAFGDFVKAQSRAIHYADTLSYHSPGSYGLHLAGIKRKWNAISSEDDRKDVSSLLLGLGLSPTSSDNSKVSSATVCTMSSAKEMDEESSMDLGLNFRLHLGNEKSPSVKRPALATPNALTMRPVCDLQLSLSTGQSQSVITSATAVSDPHQNTLEATVNVGSLPFMDDGSTSSCWRPEGSSLSLVNPSEANENMVERIPSNAEPQLLSTCVMTLKGPVTCTSGLTQQTTNMKTCQYHGCGKGARGASGLCIAHGGGRRCQREGCHKGAEGRTVYCKAHGGGRRCQSLGCMKSAEGRTDYCIAHGGGRRCSDKDCTRAARGKSGLCIRHGGGKRCQRENCTKSAEGFSGLCIAHGGGRRCQYRGCTKGAQGSTMFCKAHGGGKRCTALGCNKGAEGSTPFCKGHGGGKRCSFQGGGVCPKSVHGGTQFCVAHGGGKRCAVRECTKSARGRTDFCVRHGGGKRCKSEGCGKSAQGRTDFCKAHGGGKRCSWGQAGSDVGNGGPTCDRFARGKTGLCAGHTALVQDHRVHGGGALGPAASQCPQHVNLEKMNIVAAKEDDISAMTSKVDKDIISWNASSPRSEHLHTSLVLFPEGRVHGGSLMAMLTDGADLIGQTGYEASGNPSEQDAERALPRKWM
uniref:Putative WRKY transcription factor 19 n=1 Tax=Anthurium amnicola TaxID=1678845 RepID=A0A1D1Z7V8_9ARAE